MSANITDEDLLRIIRQMDRTAIGDIADNFPLKMNSPPICHPQTKCTKNILKLPITAFISSPARSAICRLRPSHLYCCTKMESLSKEKPSTQRQDRVEHHSTAALSIQVTPDCMQAYLIVRSQEHYGWMLKDKPEAMHMIVEAEEDRSVVLEKLRLSDVMMELQQRHLQEY